MPDKELQRFILQSVLQPFLEVKVSQGLRLSVTITFVNGKNTSRTILWDSKGITVEGRATVECFRQNDSFRIVIYRISIVPSHGDSPEFKNGFLLRGVIQQDEKGFYLSSHSENFFKIDEAADLIPTREVEQEILNEIDKP